MSARQTGVKVMPKNVKLFISVPARALLFRVWEQLFQAEREIPWKMP